MANINGTNRADNLTGTSRNDVINALAGNDTVDGGNGNDRISLGDGNDYLNITSTGNDTVYGGKGNDYIDGYTSNELFYGGEGTDTLRGNSGDDNLYGGKGNDILDGGDGDDFLNGFGGNAGAEYDTLTGGVGIDLFALGDNSKAYYTDNGYVEINDFNPVEGDYFQAFGSRSDYQIQQNGDTADIFYQGDLIAYVSNTNDVVLGDLIGTV